MMAQSQGRTGGTPNRRLSRLPETMPRATPAMPPISESTTASQRNCAMMLRFLAPMARRMPISLVRSVTDTSMMFMMPTPAATSAMEEMTAEPMRRLEVMPRNWVTTESLEMISKSSSAPGATLRRARRMPRACSTVAL